MKKIKKMKKIGFRLCKGLSYIALLCQKSKLCQVDSSSSAACAMIPMSSSEVIYKHLSAIYQGHLQGILNKFRAYL